jgi:hypothetical protein
VIPITTGALLAVTGKREGDLVVMIEFAIPHELSAVCSSSSLHLAPSSLEIKPEVTVDACLVNELSSFSGTGSGFIFPPPPRRDFGALVSFTLEPPRMTRGPW